MESIMRIPNSVTVKTADNKVTQKADLRFDNANGCLSVYISAEEVFPAYAELRWSIKQQEPLLIMCDAWERAYSELCFRGIEERRIMPWYFIANCSSVTYCCGVKVRPSAFVYFKLDSGGVTAVCDIRSGTNGVELNGRELHIADFVYSEYKNISVYRAAQSFCRIMCTDAILPDAPVYGGNNWYYAYGKSSFNDIVADTRLQAELAKGLKNRPFMTIDDGWQPRSCSGPWIANAAYGDMKKTAEAIKELDVRPGIWIRYLLNPDCKVQNAKTMPGGGLDPSNPEVLSEIVQNTQELVFDWGYELIKHDFSTYDIFNRWGSNMGSSLTDKQISFYDRSLTTAEIIVNMYRTVLNAAGGKAYILGCNTVSHLSAGLVHINRTGDDTSGVDWSRTRAYGVNTLAFRLCQNKSFYAADADCIGVIPGKIPWELNYRWAKLLAQSGTPLFLSCANGSLTKEQEQQLKELYAFASVQLDEIEPLDWTYNSIPSLYNINGKQCSFDWYNA